MSLLIDALKQAEAARTQAQSGESPETTRGIELEPIAEPGVSTPTPASNTTATPTREVRRPRPAPATSSVVASQAAKDLFEVKRPAPNRLPLILAAAGITVFLIGAGYVWWAIQPRSSLMAPGFKTAATVNQVAVPLFDSLTPAIPAGLSSSPVSESEPSRTNDSQVTVARTSVPAVPPQRERPDSFRRPPTAGARSAAVTPLNEVQPASRSTALNTSADATGIQAAYLAFLEGNYSLARQRYQEVLRQDSGNVDAMNALGLIAWRSGQLDVAERMFRAAVRADPKDATATSQLALLYSEGDVAAAEGRLRNLIAAQPNAGAAYYALGSLMSRQGRWSEAQQALFQAYTLDSDNPDVLFNLAVSLEHLAQPSPARQFYERALQAASRRPAGFDKSVAQGRVLALGSR